MLRTKKKRKEKWGWRSYVQVKNPSKFEHQFEEEWVEIETPTGEKIKKKVPPYSVHVVSKITGTEDIETKEFKRSLIILVNPFKVSRNPFVHLEPSSFSNFSKMELPFGMPNYLFVIGQDPKYFKYGTPETLNYLHSSEKWKHFSWSDLSKDQKMQILEETRWSMFDSEDRELSHWIIQKQLKKLPEDSFLHSKEKKKNKKGGEADSQTFPLGNAKGMYWSYQHLFHAQSPFSSLNALLRTSSQERNPTSLDELDPEKIHPDAFKKERKKIWKQIRKTLSPERKKKWQMYEYHYLRIPMNQTLYHMDLLFQYSLPFFYANLRSSQIQKDALFLKKKVNLVEDFSWILQPYPFSNSKPPSSSSSQSKTRRGGRKGPFKSGLKWKTSKTDSFFCSSGLASKEWRKKINVHRTNYLPGGVQSCPQKEYWRLEKWKGETSCYWLIPSYSFFNPFSSYL